jgi:enoyl-CoA hydratase
LTTRTALAAFEQQAAPMQALSQRLFESEEAREGIMAFLQKRPPAWAPE